MPDYTFAIKTPAELSGVEQAVEKFEQLRGKAKANGADFAELDKKIAAAKASIAAYNATVAATAPPTAKAADESERLAKTLEKMQSAAHEARAEEAQRAIDSAKATKATAQAADEAERYSKTLEKMASAAHESRAEEAQRQIDLANTTKVTESAGKENEEAGKKVKLFAGHGKELKKVIQELGKEFPIAGFALKALANPIAATLTIGIGFFVAIKRQIAETNKALDEMATVNAAKLSNFADNFRAAQNEATAANKEFIESLEDISNRSGEIAKSTDAAVNAIHRLAAAQIELNNAAQAKAIAEVNLAEEKKQISPVTAIAQRGQIKDFYEAEKVRVQNQTEAAEISRREQQLRMLQAARNQIPDASADGMDEATRKARIASLKETAENAKKYQDELEKGKAAAQEKVDEAAGQVGEIKLIDPSDPGAVLAKESALKEAGRRVDQAIAEQDALDARIAQAKKLRDQSESRATSLEGESKAIAEGQSKATALDQQIADLAREIKALRDAFELNRSTRAQTLDLNRSARGAETEKDQTHAIEEQRKKEEEENKRRAREADEEVNKRFRRDINPRSRKGNVSQAESPSGSESFDLPAATAGDGAVAAAFKEYHKQNLAEKRDLVAVIQQCRQEIADTGSRLGDAANNV